MREDYQLDGPTEKLQIELEKKVHDKLNRMTKNTQLSASEIVNTALKRFISAHKDFLGEDDFD